MDLLDQPARRTELALACALMLSVLQCVPDARAALQARVSESYWAMTALTPFLQAGEVCNATKRNEPVVAATAPPQSPRCPPDPAPAAGARSAF
jgi:hypothetical protein